MAAKIKTVNPDLSLLSVRGMMVHSARWTEEMKRIGSINDIMSICGYGIPDEEIALFSNERYATYIFENELIPYVRKDGSNTYNQLHFYDLPWPVELLEQMGAEKVKITRTVIIISGARQRTEKNRITGVPVLVDPHGSTIRQQICIIFTCFPKNSRISTGKIQNSDRKSMT